MLKAFLIDDEKSSLESLKIEIEAYCPDVQVVQSFSEPQIALEVIKSAQFEEVDLIFLDIEMPGMNGFELLQKLGDIFLM